MPAGTLLLTAEQGLGDTIHMIRYAPLVRQRCRAVVMQCQKALVPLLQRCAGIDRFLIKGEKLPPIDAQLPLMSLPLVFRTTLESIPASVPYVFADERLVEAWRERLSQYEGFKVGIAWQGNKKYAGDAWRSIPLMQFTPLLQVPGVRIFSLQKGEGSEQMAELPEKLRPIDFGPELDAAGAFTDTAAIMQNLDLTITSDTAIPHLAGAMGRPVWVALNYACDWRWLDGREDCPWYPTMRLFRQPRLNDWETVFTRIAEELGAVVGGDTARVLPGRSIRAAAIQVPVSAGELLDKLSILTIKSERIADPRKLANVRRELGELTAVCDRAVKPSKELTALLDQLKAVNERLWEIEDAIRACEARGDFGPQFIELARTVYTTNDRRSAVKRLIDLLVGSPLLEEKQYTRYDSGGALG